jgi:hypothetical protein
MTYSCCLNLSALLATIVSLATAALAAGADAPQDRRPPATILLIRHGEKPPVGNHLSMLGVERAEALPRLFGGEGAAPPHNLPRPDALFAAAEKRKSNRPVETLVPLSRALGLPIDSHFMDDDCRGLAKRLLRGAFAGKVVLVSWRHDNLPALARALGVEPPYKTWPDGQFDRVWRIDYRNGAPALTEVPQSLVPVDSK